MGGCQELLQNKPFIFKFVELCAIVILAIIWYVKWWDYVSTQYCYLLGMTLLYSCFYYFFPVFIMAVLLGLKKFQDQKYALIICIAGAVCAGAGAVLLILFKFTKIEDSNQIEEYANKIKSFLDHGEDDTNTSVIILIIFELLLMVLFILDIFVGGGSK